MSYEKIFYCTRCGHREDCHEDNSKYSEPRGLCSGRTKKGAVCQCPRYARGKGVDRKAMNAARGGHRAS